jgi:hypothetical protein
MAQCGVCGREFDPARFQVIVPGLGQGFDRLECAAQARASHDAAPGSTPLAAAVRSGPAPAASPPAAAPLAAPAMVARRPLLWGANLALLAVGTAATVFLWFRVFGVDPSAFEPDPGTDAAHAYERSQVPAQLSTAGTSSQPKSEPAAKRAAAALNRPAERRATAERQRIATAPAVVTAARRRTGSGGDSASREKPSKTFSSAPPRALADGGGGQGNRGRSETAPHGKAKGHDKHHSKDHDRAHSSGRGKKKGHAKHQH